MVSSKELLGVLRLLAKLPLENKEALLSRLHGQQDNGDTLLPPASSLEKAEE